MKKRTIYFVALVGMTLCLLAGCSKKAEQGLMVGIVDLCSGNVASANMSYVKALEKAGQIPVIIPQMESDEAIDKLVEKLDIVLFIGGEDVNPDLYQAAHSPRLGELNHVRDLFETRVMSRAKLQHKPIMGICRGVQFINVSFGGTLYQDLPTEFAVHEVNHNQPTERQGVAHAIQIEKDSRLSKAFGVTELNVNSTHHQAVKDLAPGFKVTATAPDGVIEAIESTEYPVAGVQFHPEQYASIDKPEFVRFFKYMHYFVTGK